jgi:hypothetical protein
MARQAKNCNIARTGFTSFCGAAERAETARKPRRKASPLTLGDR